MLSHVQSGFLQVLQFISPSQYMPVGGLTVLKSHWVLMNVQTDVCVAL